MTVHLESLEQLGDAEGLASLGAAPPPPGAPVPESWVWGCQLFAYREAFFIRPGRPGRFASCLSAPPLPLPLPLGFASCLFPLAPDLGVWAYTKKGVYLKLTGRLGWTYLRILDLRFGALGSVSRANFR